MNNLELGMYLPSSDIPLAKEVLGAVERAGQDGAAFTTARQAGMAIKLAGFGLLTPHTPSMAGVTRYKRAY